MAQLNAPIFRSSDPLVALAAQRRLPRCQVMDATTLRWIQDNRPDLPAAPTDNPPMAIARYAIVPSGWFARMRQVDSIHGVRHGGRVAILAAHLARMLHLPRREAMEAVIAGALHDCQRLHDKDDPGHGARAARWFADRHAQIVASLHPHDHDVRVHVIAAAMGLHDVPYTQFTRRHTQRYAEAKTVCDIVKTADALDRYRLPKLKWWPRHEHLRLIPPPWLHRYAFDLVVTTERNRLQGMSSERAIVAALAEETL